MAEAGYGRPSEILNGRLGDLALDCEVWKVATEIGNRIAAAREKNPKTGEREVLIKLQRDAAAERAYEAKHGRT
jgi:hypothetical protein